MKNLKKIKFLIMDVDGVLTDGSVYVGENGKEYLRFSRIDGKGISLLKEAGIKIGAISAEESKASRHRLEKLCFDYIAFGVRDKLEIYEKWKKELGLKDENICFCGDDVQDMDLIRRTGFSCCPQNAQEIIKKRVHYISNLKGGEGFVREICNLILGGKNE